MSGKVYVIAEVGFNHEGDMPVALEMIEAAANAGADAVKFQTFKAQDIALPSSPHFELIRAGELTPEQHKTLFDAARRQGVEFLSTPFSVEAVKLLNELGVSAFKIASMDCTNVHLLSAVAATKKPLYVSTGMANLEEIGQSLAFLRRRQSGPVTLLHCLSLYPPKPADLNLDAIPLLRRLFNVPVGYSDHFPGTSACLASAMLGAEVIETHFTLDATQQGGDHFHSVDPQALRELLQSIALFGEMKGSSEELLRRADRSYASLYRRGLYAARAIAAGEELREEDLLLCRPETSLSPSDLPRLVGRKLTASLEPGAALEERFLAPAA